MKLEIGNKTEIEHVIESLGGFVFPYIGETVRYGVEIHTYKFYCNSNGTLLRNVNIPSEIYDSSNNAISLVHAIKEWKGGW